MDELQSGGKHSTTWTPGRALVTSQEIEFVDNPLTRDQMCDLKKEGFEEKALIQWSGVDVIAFLRDRGLQPGYDVVVRKSAVDGVVMQELAQIYSRESGADARAVLKELGFSVSDGLKILPALREIEAESFPQHPNPNRQRTSAHKSQLYSLVRNNETPLQPIACKNVPRQLARHAPPTGRWGELYAVFMRFRWQLLIALIVILEATWYAVFNRLYNAGYGSIFFWLRGFPGMVAVPLMFHYMYWLLVPGGPSYTDWIVFVGFVIFLFMVPLFVYYNSAKYLKPLFPTVERNGQMAAALLSSLGVYAGSIAYLSFSKRQHFTIINPSTGRPSLLFVVMSSFILFWCLIVPSYKWANNKSIPDDVQIGFTCTCCLFVVCQVIADTKQFLILGVDKFRKRCGGGYILLQTAFAALGSMWVLPVVFKSLHAIYCGDKSVECESEWLLLFLLSFSAVVLALYILNRVIVSRFVPADKVSLYMLPFMFAQDFFCELIFLDFQITTARFWILALFDTFLLIMRDAELWDDITTWAWNKTPGLGSLVMIVELLGGNADGIGERLVHDKKANKAIRKMSVVGDLGPTRTPRATRQSRRHVTETAVLTEILSTALILLLVLYDTVFEDNNFPMDRNNKNFTIGTNALVTPFAPEKFQHCNVTVCKGNEKVFVNEAQYCVNCLVTSMQQLRYSTLHVYLVIMLLQFLGLSVSHRIVEYKNSVSERLERIAAVARQPKVPLGAGLTYHFFLSHAQETGQDQTSSLCQTLQSYGFICWYDMDAANLTQDGMKQGVASSDIYLLFLSKGALSRPFVQLELREARRLNKKIVTVHEPDVRHGQFDFAAELQHCPDDLQFVARDIESIPYRRRRYEKTAMVQQISQSAGPGYSRHVRQTEAHSTKDSQKWAHRTSAISGSWFLDENAIERVDEHWKAHIMYRICTIIAIVHLCVLMVVHLRNQYGLTQKQSATAF